MLADFIQGVGAFLRTLNPTEKNYPSYSTMAKELANVVDDPKRSREEREKARKLIREFMRK